MSHFSVMVIGADYEKQLAPYHEYECTGRDDEYVVDVDVTDKVAETFAKPVKAIQLADGSWHSRWDDRFYTKPPPEHWFGNKGFEMPPGGREVELSADDARSVGLGYGTMDDAADGYVCRDGRYYKRTNPNAKWDWYMLGGRWTGALKLKGKAFGLAGKPGLMTERAPDGYADQALKGDVDFTQMRNDAEVKARALWTTTRGITGGSAWETWDDTRIRYPDIDDARREYNEQPAILLLKASGNKAYSWDIDDDLALDLDTYIQRQRDQACVHFAFVRDGQWTERGRMGWFACVSDEISESQWNRMFNDMLDALPDDTLISIVDCHI